MHLIPLQTPRIVPGEDLVSALMEARKDGFQPKDIVVISSKAVATSEGRIIDLSALTVSDKAKTYAEKSGRSPEFCQAVLDEVAFHNGSVVGTCPGALLTELKPDGLSTGIILTANAGLDESNAPPHQSHSVARCGAQPEGTAIGWPEDPVESAKEIQSTMEAKLQTDKFLVSSFWFFVLKKISNRFLKLETKNQQLKTSQPHIAVIISDSCCRPRRWGVTAYALAVAGMDPLQDQKGVKDLYGRELRITQEAIADQLATAANTLMGNADRACPAVLIRDHGIPLSEFVGWVPWIEPEKELFNGVL